MQIKKLCRFLISLRSIRNDRRLQGLVAASKACYGGLDPPSPDKTVTIYQGIAGLRCATPAMTKQFWLRRF
jgi:hypothetical protein